MILVLYMLHVSLLCAWIVRHPKCSLGRWCTKLVKDKEETGHIFIGGQQSIPSCLQPSLPIRPHQFGDWKRTWCWDHLQGILIWLHRTSCAIWGTLWPQ